MYLNAKGHGEMNVDIPVGKSEIKAPVWFIPIGFALFCWVLAALFVNY